jgi:hypothetical protein
MVVKPQQRVMSSKTAFAFDNKNRYAWINIWNIPSKVGDQKFARETCYLKWISMMCSIRSSPIPSMKDIAVISSMCNQPTNDINMNQGNEKVSKLQGVLMLPSFK